MRHLSFLLILAFVTSVQAEDVRIVLWNGEELFKVSDVNDRRSDLEAFAAHFDDVDILLIDEVCSLAVVERVRDLMGLDGFHVVCSDFSQNDNNQHGSFEVGVISRFPITQAVEYDVTPDNRPHSRGGEPAERPLAPDSILKLGLAKAKPGRGFLWVRIDDLKLTIALAHLKSSRSSNEAENAQKREFVAAAMALSVLEDRENFPGYSYVVAGDLNVGFTDLKKNGEDLVVDAIGGEAGDRYDDTHAIFGKGLIGGLKMTNLTANVGETFDSNQFPGTGPIDNIYVEGEIGAFAEAEKTMQTFGSDHFAVSTVYSVP